MKEEVSLPDNAFRPLKEGEEYEPLMKPNKQYREVTPWSIVWGLLMAVIFSAATAYLGLKVGQVFEAAIPITIIAVGVSGATHRKDPLGENIIIQSIGACSGMIVAGAIFTLPALYILQHKYPELTVNFLQVFLSSVLGGILGILFLIPFRKYFVKDMHGKYPFPEATASTQVLISGERSGSQAKPLLVAGIVGGLFDFAVAAFGAWNENFTSRCCELGTTIADKAKFVFSINTSAALLGMGYIVGLKYAAIICFGSIAVWWVIVPGIALIFPDMTIADGVVAASASPEQLFSYAKSIGIGGIAMAGIIGVIKSWNVIKSAFGLVGQIFKSGNIEKHVERTQRDISMKIIAIGSLLTIIVTALFFYFDVMGGNLLFTIVGIFDCSNYRIPLHHSRSKRHCHCWVKPRQRHDTDDTHTLFHHHGCCRLERYRWHGRSTHHGRCGMHRTFICRCFHHRPQNWLLAWCHPQKTRNLQVPWYFGISSHSGRCHHDIEQSLWLYTR